MNRYLPLRLGAALIAVLLMALAWWMVLAAERGVQSLSLTRDGVPVTLLLPAVTEPAPGVVMAHGFAGSDRLMRHWALTLARAGVVVALPDLSGHGRNQAPLDWWNDPEQFQRDVQTALDLLLSRPEVDHQRLGLLGHSLGAGAAIDAGRLRLDDVSAVVAISPGQSEVGPDSPRNLMLMAGAWEGPFLAAAKTLLEQAGGEGGDPLQGTARTLTVIPHAEHIGILFRHEAHAASLAWFARAWDLSIPDVSPNPTLAWWLLHLLAVLILWRALVPLFAHRESPSLLGMHPDWLDHTRRPLLRAALSGIGATLALIGIGEVIYLDGLGGILVSPQFALWLALAGLFWLALGTRPPRPEWSDLGWGMVMFGVLMLAFGVLGAKVWLAWWPPLHRLPYLPVLTLLILPWALALSTALLGREGIRGFGLGLGITLVTMVTVGIAAAVVDGMMFLLIILPLLPVMLALPLLVSLPAQRPWAGGLAMAAFLGWTLTMMFPLI
ncbi:alpha/beta fold hydrolase [Ectothiorhodospira shaposhnikovii]|uniref:alpha/beta fold hydrolase n=1 Tax=Ectothiorhodospira shaposhnikovii TaxID=1054 RepID=UPI0039A15944